jgi:hypothetical protein
MIDATHLRNCWWLFQRCAQLFLATLNRSSATVDHRLSLPATCLCELFPIDGVRKLLAAERRFADFDPLIVDERSPRIIRSSRFSAHFQEDAFWGRDPHSAEP